MAASIFLTYNACGNSLKGGSKQEGGKWKDVMAPPFPTNQTRVTGLQVPKKSSSI
ncbi:hypothetical protein SLEP1_g58083 [Rubroshorea leprosula]|uniref:Uncharacterized protein n=1 Tax=Rubroshorea leprosula TaxID=152421 RepID=A0AAV5MP96_9ROSI|nr:hypothetical protein SLEP1_g58083 [Rubroshorea leprosula]